MRLKTIFRSAACCLAICVSQVADTRLSMAAEGVTLPATAKLVVQLDLSAFGKTSIGKRLVDLTSKTAAEEIGTDGENVIAKVHETLGFDPLKEIQTVTLAVSDFQNPEESVSAVVQMGDTTGNLEGLLLALPNYESSEFGEYTLHSVGEGDMQATGTIHADSKGDHWIFVAPGRPSLMTLIGSNTEGESTSSMTIDSLSKGAFLSAELLEIPMDAIDDQPFSNIAGLLKSLRLTVSERDETMLASLKIVTASEKKAQQIQQLVQGVTAAASLAIDSVEELQEEEYMDAAMGALDTLKVSRKGETVTVSVSLATRLIVDFLREEADLPL